MRIEIHFCIINTCWQFYGLQLKVHKIQLLWIHFLQFNKGTYQILD